MQRLNQHGNRTLHFALIVRILYAQKEYATALMRQPLVSKGAVQVSQMDKSRRARAQPGNFRPLGQLTRRIHLLVILRRFPDLWKQQIR